MYSVNAVVAASLTSTAHPAYLSADIQLVSAHAIDRYILPAGPSAANPPAATETMDGRTDGRTDA